MNCANCCKDLDIRWQDLFWPERLDARGREFIEAHGLLQVPIGELMRGAQLLEDGVTVKVRHRCQKLNAENLCTMYEKRPAICREFDCATRRDCTQQPRLITDLLAPQMPAMPRTTKVS